MTDLHPKVQNMTLTGAVGILVSALWNGMVPNHQIDSTVALAAATVILFVVGYFTPSPKGKPNG